MSNTAVYPGSFDPLTLGHIDIINRSSKFFDNLIVSVLVNPSKSHLFSESERVQIISNEFKNNPKITVNSFSGLLVDHLNTLNSKIIIRGLRAISDYDYETQMALTNKSLNQDIETFFMAASAKYSYISSSMVKQVAKLNGNVSEAVSKNVENLLKERFSN